MTMNPSKIEVIATTSSGSIADWKKVERIAPLFAEHGMTQLRVHVVEGHVEARAKAAEVIAEGSRLLISAGGSGTFKNVLEGCCDSGVDLGEFRLGFLRKGSADLIGKVLNMPDEIEEAIAVFAAAIRADTVEMCDVLSVESFSGGKPVQHFVGYGGAEIFGRIPHYTENRFMKWYKGVLSQFFGDLGPFTTGMILSLLERVIKYPWAGRGRWKIVADGELVGEDRFQALVLVNGYLGPELAFSSDTLGSGRFQLFGLRNQGLWRMPKQAMRARSGAIKEDPERWGLAEFSAHETMELIPEKIGDFSANVDGSTLICRGGLRVRRVGQIPLIARVDED
jgi:diacylglycerol kinase family enzyme